MDKLEVCQGRSEVQHTTVYRLTEGNSARHPDIKQLRKLQGNRPDAMQRRDETALWGKLDAQLTYCLQCVVLHRSAHVAFLHESSR